jgi:hypothetical protein
VPALRGRVNGSPYQGCCVSWPSGAGEWWHAGRCGAGERWHAGPWLSGSGMCRVRPAQGGASRIRCGRRAVRAGAGGRCAGPGGEAGEGRGASVAAGMCGPPGAVVVRRLPCPAVSAPSSSWGAAAGVCVPVGRVSGAGSSGRWGAGPGAGSARRSAKGGPGRFRPSPAARHPQPARRGQRSAFGGRRPAVGGRRAVVGPAGVRGCSAPNRGHGSGAAPPAPLCRAPGPGRTADKQTGGYLSGGDGAVPWPDPDLVARRAAAPLPEGFVRGRGAHVSGRTNPDFQWLLVFAALCVMESELPPRPAVSPGRGRVE